MKWDFLKIDTINVVIQKGVLLSMEIKSIVLQTKSLMQMKKFYIDTYVAPVFVGYVEEQQEVTLNYEHSEYKWLSFKEAIDMVSLPGNDEVLISIEKHFVMRNPSEYLRIEN